MTTIVENAVQGAGTHILVVGVGAYPHLIGGEGPLLQKEHASLGQLSSPPLSARLVADWFIESHHLPDKPLASVRLLLSDADSEKYRGKDVETASVENLTTSIKEWKKAGDSHQDNLLIFYFCGHGIGSGSDLALLARDFGADTDNPLDGALDFRKLTLGMLGRCEAKHICYFVDACRMSAEVTDEGQDFWGRVPILPKLPKLGRQGPTFYSTLLGSKAYSKKNAVSYFTQALLRGLNGAGADDSEGDWRVTTTQLKRAIDGAIQRQVDAREMSEQITPTSNLTTFELHRPTSDPEVPVFVHCRPEAANGLAHFECWNGAVAQSRQPEPSPWALSLGVGTYTFKARFSSPLPAGADYNDAERSGVIIYPPHKVVPLEVT